MKTVEVMLNYCNLVVAGRIHACRTIRQACLRHLSDLRKEDSEFYFDEEAADRVIRFAKKLKHWEGEWAGQYFDPMPWQVFILGSIFGWKRKDNNKRRFRYAYIEIPRKNGKSFLASVVALYMLIADGEEGAQVYSVATKREQAKIVWDGACRVAEKSKIRQTSLHWLALRVKQTNSRFEPLASDSTKLDGLNPHCAICDELHEWPDRGLWDVIEDAFGARSQPLMFVITTAGFNKFGICYQQHTHSKSILEGVEKRSYVDDTYFAFIAGTDKEDEDKWQSPITWAKANPCLGQSKSVEYMRDQCNKAKLMLGKRNSFLNKQLDIWTEAEKKWLDMEKWDACSGEIDTSKLRGKPCYAALDLSSTTDITALNLLFPPGPYSEWVTLSFFFYPKDNLRKAEERDRVPYLTWEKEGFIIATPGDIIDLDFIFKHVCKMGDLYSIQEVGFDPWKAVEIATKLQNEGFTMVQMRQGHATLGAPTRQLETYVLKGQLRHGGNPVLRWMAQNTSVITDSNDNIRPDKGGDASGTVHARNRIDGIVALIMSIGRASFGNTTKKESIFEKRGVIVF